MKQDKENELLTIFKKLSPENQSYMMTLAQVAAVAENAAKNALSSEQAPKENQE